jgi:hypothetical protein
MRSRRRAPYPGNSAVMLSPRLRELLGKLGFVVLFFAMVALATYASALIDAKR